MIKKRNNYFEGQIKGKIKTRGGIKKVNKLRIEKIHEQEEEIKFLRKKLDEK